LPEGLKPHGVNALDSKTVFVGCNSGSIVQLTYDLNNPNVKAIVKKATLLHPSEIIY
jgi:hypothetical protein